MEQWLKEESGFATKTLLAPRGRRPCLRHIYLGEHDWSTPLPETADLVQPDEVQCDDLIAYIGTASPVLGAAPIKAKQACYLPRHVRFGEDRGPLIGQTTVPGLPGRLASGHTCWGIQNGPATGCLMSELLLDGRRHPQRRHRQAASQEVQGARYFYGFKSRKAQLRA
ncbi:hypothetical protein B0T24DRAFT_600241 [Lasiosphaeria ovina]|uniref:FAD dependent oxidoreductase domain-containing protein n=1 Tax=Lasiosphaeria ovina TaxID=92902 RepID=A0AAE0JRG3_9PEZI|nr:hypothetical protein B0T24DRAFT_600241 [Lasiosphaeria ovina]